MFKRLVPLLAIGASVCGLAAGCEDSGVLPLSRIAEADGRVALDAFIGFDAESSDDGEGLVDLDRFVGIDAEPAPTDPPAVESIESLIARYFGPFAGEASQIAWCESRHTENVISRTNDYGLFQINRTAHEGGLVRELGYSMDDLLTLEANVHVAWELFDQSGRSWQPWSCSRKLGLR